MLIWLEMRLMYVLRRISVLQSLSAPHIESRCLLGSSVVSLYRWDMCSSSWAHLSSPRLVSLSLSGLS